MRDEIKNELTRLLETYPDLENSVIRFQASKIEQILPDTNQSTTPICRIKEKAPDVIIGPSIKIGIFKSPIQGYGIFAKERLEEGEYIEESKLLKLENRERYLTDPVLKDYVWVNRACNCEECNLHGHNVYIGLGFASLYNHSDKPNTIQKLDFKKEIFTLKAKQIIEKGNEIFVTYGEKYFLIRNFWKNIRNTNKFEEAIRNKGKFNKKE